MEGSLEGVKGHVYAYWTEELLPGRGNCKTKGPRQGKKKKGRKKHGFFRNSKETTNDLRRV